MNVIVKNEGTGFILNFKNKILIKKIRNVFLL